MYVGSGRGSRKEVDKPAQDSFSEVPALSATVERLDLEELFLDGNALADLRTLVPHCMSSASIRFCSDSTTGEAYDANRSSVGRSC